jgi:hypothetical protein
VCCAWVEGRLVANQRLPQGCLPAACCRLVAWSASTCHSLAAPTRALLSLLPVAHGTSRFVHNMRGVTGAQVVHVTAMSRHLLVLHPSMLQMQLRLTGCGCNYIARRFVYKVLCSCALCCGCVLRALPPFWGDSQPPVVSLLFMSVSSSQTFQLRLTGLPAMTVLRRVLAPSAHAPQHALKLSPGVVF